MVPTVQLFLIVSVKDSRRVFLKIHRRFSKIDERKGFVRKGSVRLVAFAGGFVVDFRKPKGKHQPDLRYRRVRKTIIVSRVLNLLVFENPSKINERRKRLRERNPFVRPFNVVSFWLTIIRIVYFRK